jgi:GrpB-like predicted nucleotidyltransferase (UPF0157 family)
MTIDEPIVIVDYDEEWPTWYLDDVRELKAVLGASVGEVAHVGSTSVPGLAAKPIIDILVGALTWPMNADLRGAIESMGYKHVADPSMPRCVFGAVIPGREYFIRRDAAHPTNLVVVEWRGKPWEEISLIYSYLRQHPLAAAQYGRAKQLNFHNGAKTLVPYSEQKFSTVSQILIAARAWQSAGGPTPTDGLASSGHERLGQPPGSSPSRAREPFGS